MPNDKQTPKELKVTDRRIFTSEGEIRDEFKADIKPADAPAPAEPRREEPSPTPPKEKKPPVDERRRTIADKATNPGSPFTNFIEPLIAQGYMSLGLLRNPYQPQTKTDPAAARQMIDILTLLKEKTAGNLSADEEDFLATHLGELKLAFVQKTKSI